MGQLSNRRVDTVVAAAMLVSLFLAIAHTSLFDVSAQYQAVNDMAKEIRVLSQPFILFSVVSLLGVVAAVAGAAMHIFGWRFSRHVLIACGVCTLVSSQMVNVYVQSSLTSASGFAFSVCLGWLIARADKPTS